MYVALVYLFDTICPDSILITELNIVLTQTHTLKKENIHLWVR